MQLASWNVRWLVSPHTPQGMGKRLRIQRALTAGKVVALQETHWDVEIGGVWEGLFPAARVIHSGAIPGPRGGARGGVAIIVPIRYQVLRYEVLVPGCAVEAVLSLRSVEGEDCKEVSIQSLYFPPDGGPRR
jgi:hypothetical protein